MTPQKKIDSGYGLLEDGGFRIDDYNEKRPFSDFLPGIAGLYGIPMWVFFVNRGQAIASFGTRNKDNAILEFFPANKAYQNTPSMSFRTFLKIGGHSAKLYEPFRQPSAAAKDAPLQSLEIRSHELLLRETNRAAGLETEVRYFTVPGEPLAVLARELVLKNISGRPLEIEFLDGLPMVNPYGMNEFFVKQMSRTIEAWMVAENVEKRAPFLRLKVDATDRPEVEIIEEGNFFFGCLEEAGKKAALLAPLVDPSVVFGPKTDFSEPDCFYRQHPFKPASQITENRTPCAFLHGKLRLAAGKSATVRSFFGHARNVELVNRYAARAVRRGYAESKREENRLLIESLKSPVFTATSSKAYDLYCGQTFLDNLMRGGVPVRLGDRRGGVVFHAYSRKHGDLERDYNRFLVEPTFFSQGDGNYRDVNQNRRSDVWFLPEVRDLNIKTFLNLIQLDGFNPLVIKGSVFTLKRTKEAARALAKLLGAAAAKRHEKFFSGAFTLGECFRFLESHGLTTPARFERFIAELAPHLAREERAEHGEGFWVDHWTYNLDLIENYLAIYPEDKEALLFERRDYMFRDSDHFVRPRREKYFIKRPGVVRQYQAVAKDKSKAELIASRQTDAGAVRTRHGRGEVYRTMLFVKLLCLFANKIASLDAHGIGIEMEADKPSWYDALNGLPGLLGSSTCEAFELKRLALFLIAALEDADPADGVTLPAELYEFIEKTAGSLARHLQDRNPTGAFEFWNETASAKERWRARTAQGLSGKEKKLAFGRVKAFLEHAREKLEIGLERAFQPATGLYPTYYQNEVKQYASAKGSTHAEAEEFKQTPLPHFLEGAVHALKIEKDPARKRALLAAVRKSRLYDAKLGMYKVNAPFGDTSLEIGRACVFAPGWLENESIWLHMEYKFLLEILKSGMTEEFFKDFRRALVPFQDPARYGRSILENSSFIVSSAFVDPSLHGGGFVARLSGSTAEFLTMWLLMNVGKRPFLMGPDGKLSLRFQPSLPEFLFTTAETTRTLVTADGESRTVRVPKNCVAFLFLGKTLVFYHNPRSLDTFGKTRAAVKKITLTLAGGQTIDIKGDTIPSPWAAKVRDERVPRIDIELG